MFGRDKLVLHRVGFGRRGGKHLLEVLRGLRRCAAGDTRQAVQLGLQKRPGPIQLFDLDSDLGEENDIAAENPAVVARIERAFREAHTPSE